MKKKQTLKYILCDTLAAVLSWMALFLFRKLVLESSALSLPFTPSHFLSLLINDSNFWLGLIIVPAGWLSLYTILGTYRNVLRKARLKETTASPPTATITFLSFSSSSSTSPSPTSSASSSPLRPCAACTPASSASPPSS